MPEIWAVLEHNAYSGGTLHEKGGELLAELVEIAQRQQEETTLCAVLLSSPQPATSDISLLSRLGVQHLYLLEHQDLADYSTEGYVSTLAWLMQQRTPVLVSTSATANGRDWMPRLAARLHLPFVPGCLGLDLHDDAIFALRAVYEGRAYIQIRTERRGRTALATFVPGVRGTPGTSPHRQQSNEKLINIRRGEGGVERKGGPLWSPALPHSSTYGSSQQPPPAGDHKGPLHPSQPPSPLRTFAPTGTDTDLIPSLAISRFTPEISGRYERGRIQRVAIQAPSPEEVELDAADRIVAGGRGVGREGFASIAAFARLLGASVGATRVATDRGWIEHARQIGTTGKSVHPKLYIACGISGAAQHAAGMRDAQTVVAINPDRTAPIFALADLGLLGDANSILPLAAKMIEQSKHSC